MLFRSLAGTAEVLSAGATAWVPARLRAEVGEGGGMRTLGVGRAALRTGGGHALRLASFTSIQFPRGERAPGDRLVRVQLEAGRLWVAVLPSAGPRPAVEVLAGPVTVRVRGSGVGLRTNRDGSVLVRVYHGVASCSGPAERRDWERELKAGEEILVPAAGAPGATRKLTREEEESLWVRWNEEQDATVYGGPPVK